MKKDLFRARWRKSSWSGGMENCVEVGDGLEDTVGVRDSKDPAGPALTFTARQWAAFTGAVKAGKLSR
jgi:hypothetical protein